jgi:hypothetical protein
MTFATSHGALRSLTIFSAIFLLFSEFTVMKPAEGVVGMCESEEKNLQIEMFEDHGNFSGRMFYFKCNNDDVMRSSLDVENPDKDLTGESCWA